MTEALPRCCHCQMEMLLDEPCEWVTKLVAGHLYNSGRTAYKKEVRRRKHPFFCGGRDWLQDGGGYDQHRAALAKAKGAA